MEAPWIKGAPSEYFPKHFRIGTYSLESTLPAEALERVLGTIPEIESILMYTGCYPSWEWADASAVAARIPERWHAGVFNDNARAFYRFPSSFHQSNRSAAQGKLA